MNLVFYSKVVLTIIAVCLMVLVGGEYDVVPSAIASQAVRQIHCFETTPTSERSASIDWQEPVPFTDKPRRAASKQGLPDQLSYTAKGHELREMGWDTAVQSPQISKTFAADVEDQRKTDLDQSACFRCCSKDSW